MELNPKQVIAEEARGVGLSAKEIQQNSELLSDSDIPKINVLNLLYKSMNDNKHSWSLKDNYTKKAS